MRPQDIISRKRDGERLSAADISAFVDGVTSGDWADYQISAMLMAMYLNELDASEQAAITQAMLNSGQVFDFSDIDKPKVDKHSTGGVGDKTSLIIAPMLASCDLAVPMISGRGLGHTGGTLDKLESIPGFNVRLSNEEFREIIRKCGYAMTGQTDEIVPADKKLYALRDATATVSTIPLMVASIMSKKLAEGLDALVLDVKIGSGAFMTEMDGAVRLAKAMVETGNSCGVATDALITDMNQPLGKYVGNSLEVYECIKVLQGEADPEMSEMVEVAVGLAARLLVRTGTAQDVETAEVVLKKKLADGSALEKFAENVSLQGGDASICHDPQRFIDDSLVAREIVAKHDGYVDAIDAKAIGDAVCLIGGGRIKAEDIVDPGVGYMCISKIGMKVGQGDPLGILYCRSNEQFARVQQMILDAYRIDSNPVGKAPLIKKVIS